MFQIIAQEMIKSASIKRSTNSEHTVVIIDDNTNYNTQESLSVDHVRAHTGRVFVFTSMRPAQLRDTESGTEGGARV